MSEGKDGSGMRKILLDFRMADTKERVQEYLMQSFEFLDYYGRNLDALFDMLTGLGEDTCVGVFGIDNSREALAKYLGQVKRVMQDAERENPHLCVIFEAYEDNFAGVPGNGEMAE